MASQSRTKGGTYFKQERTQIPLQDLKFCPIAFFYYGASVSGREKKFKFFFSTVFSPKQQKKKKNIFSVFPKTAKKKFKFFLSTVFPKTAEKKFLHRFSKNCRKLFFFSLFSYDGAGVNCRKKFCRFSGKRQKKIVNEL